MSVERPNTHREDEEEENGIWVVFSKKFQGEKFHVRFPGDPAYSYLPGGMLLDAAHGEDRFNLKVESADGKEVKAIFNDRLQEIETLPQALVLKTKLSSDGRMFDLFYQCDEKWVWERMIASSKLCYTFHTESPEMSGEAHRQFISSLDIFQ